MPKFNLHKFLIDVFDPQPGETVLVMVDVPHDNIKDNNFWKDRRAMAEEWHEQFAAIAKERNFELLPFLTYPATGKSGHSLPENGLMEGKEVLLDKLFSKTTLVVALTQYSSTAPLTTYAEKLPKFRAASMPGVTKKMEQTGFAADYQVVSKRCAELKRYMEKADALEVEFSTGHKCFFDLRYRKPFVDDGIIHTKNWGKGPDSVLNLPGGETFETPYEGEKQGVPSLTKGELPLNIEGNDILFVIDKNKVKEIKGESKLAKYWRELIAKDNGLRNIAEVAFGCNEMADPAGPIIESEKTGFHWAIGISDHLGGVFGEKDFDDPKNGCHEDFIYAGKNIVIVKKAVLIDKDGQRVTVMENGKYVV